MGHQETGFDFGAWFLPLFSIILLVGAVIAIYLGAKSRKMGMKEYLNIFFLEAFDLFIFIFLIASYLSEAIVATVLHPPNEFVVNSAARWITHNGVSFFGLICAIQSAKLITEVGKSLPFLFKKTNSSNKTTQESSPGFVFLLTCAAAITTYGALIIPYWNTSIIAKGFDQVHVFNYAWDNLIHPFTKKSVIASWYGIDPNKAIIENMGYNMTASYILMLCHLLGSALKGIMAALDSYLYGSISYSQLYSDRLKKQTVATNLNQNINTRGNASNTSAANAANTANAANPNNNTRRGTGIQTSLENCLKLLPEFNNDDTKIADFAKSILAKSTQFDATVWANYIREFNSHYDSLLSIENSSVDVSVKDSQKEALRAMIKQTICNPVDNSGLEMTLPS